MSLQDGVRGGPADIDPPPGRPGFQARFGGRVMPIGQAAAEAAWEKHEDRKEAGKPPKPGRIDVDDITMESVPLILAENPRGIIRFQDELTALLMGMNQYKGGKGNDQPTLLKIWSGSGIKKDRVNHEANIPIRCPHPFMAIIGGLPPDMLGSMTNPLGHADGFLDRFLFAYPDPVPVPEWSRRGVCEETASAWYDLVVRLWGRPMNVKEGRSVPHVAFMTPEGEAAWVACFNAHAAEMNEPGFPPSLRGPWGKMRDYAGRLALILACADHASDPTSDASDIPRVGGRTIRDAWRLVAYFKSQVRRVHATIANGAGSDGKVYNAVLSWIRDGQLDRFSVHQLKQARRWIEDDDASRALAKMARRNVVRLLPEEDARPSKGGRPKSPTYLVNPLLLVA